MTPVDLDKQEKGTVTIAVGVEGDRVSLSLTVTKAEEEDVVAKLYYRPEQAAQLAMKLVKAADLLLGPKSNLVLPGENSRLPLNRR